MKKIVILITVLSFLFLSFALAENNWLVREKQNDGWVLYEDGSIEKAPFQNPEMRDPYGHDKDNDRERSERSRVIKETQQTQTQEPILYTEFAREEAKEVGLYDGNGNLTVSIYENLTYINQG